MKESERGREDGRREKAYRREENGKRGRRGKGKRRTEEISATNTERKGRKKGGEGWE